MDGQRATSAEDQVSRGAIRKFKRGGESLMSWEAGNGSYKDEDYCVARRKGASPIYSHSGKGKHAPPRRQDGDGTEAIV